MNKGGSQEQEKKARKKTMARRKHAGRRHHRGTPKAKISHVIRTLESVKEEIPSHRETHHDGRHRSSESHRKRSLAAKRGWRTRRAA